MQVNAYAWHAQERLKTHHQIIAAVISKVSLKKVNTLNLSKTKADVLIPIIF